MKWLAPDEELLLRRIYRRHPFDRGDQPIIDRLVERGILSSREIICPHCGRHPAITVSFTERGKIACTILDVLAQNPVI